MSTHARINPADLSDTLLEAALENTERAQHACTGLSSPADEALAAERFAKAALAQVQAASTLHGWRP